MNDIPRITFCIPSKSNLRYLKNCIKSIKQNAYRKDHEIIVFVDEDSDGTMRWLDTQAGVRYLTNPDMGHSLYGIAAAYNTCVEHATTDIVMMFHADMVLGPNADYKAFQYLTKETVVSLTRIKPPLHPAGKEKIIYNFGLWPEDFREQEFLTYCNIIQEENRGKITHGCFAPWMVYKSVFDEIGGHDPIFHSYHEDSDIFNRFVLKGLILNQVWSALVYHLTCRGGVFEEGLTQKSERALKVDRRSTLEFIRKWTDTIHIDDEWCPIVNEKRDFGVVIQDVDNPDPSKPVDVDIQLIGNIEPWATVYVPKKTAELAIKHIQPTTQFDLTQRIVACDDLDNCHNDIVIFCERKDLDKDGIEMLIKLFSADFYHQEGAYQFGNFVIEINRIRDLTKENIDRNNQKYQAKLLKHNNMTGYIGGI